MTYLQKIFKSGRYYCTLDGAVISNVASSNRNKILKPTIGTNGYALYTLVCEKGKRYCVTGHRAVCVYFIGKIPNGHQVNHKDMNKLNNALSNLEIVTPSENKKHAALHGKNGGYYKGERHLNSKLTNLKVQYIRASSESNYKLGTVFKVSARTIRNVRNRDTWKHI